MIVSLVAEFIGTLVFVMAVKTTQGDPLRVGISLMAMIIFASSLAVRAGHLNPAVSVMSYLGGKLSLIHLFAFLGAQTGGAVVAHYLTGLLGRGF